MSHDAWPTTRLSLLLRVKDPTAEDAWDDFVARYHPPMVSMLRDVFRLQDAEAQDVAQEVLIKLVRAMQSFEYDPDKKFRAWVRTITRNSVRDAFRSKSARTAVGTGNLKVKLILESLPDGSTEGFAEEISQQIHRDLLQDAELVVKARVEPHTWDAYLAAKSGTSAKNIAADTGMTIAAVYKAKSKVTKMIRAEISQLLSQG